MTLYGKDSRLVLLISSLLIVVPMVVFPRKLGMDLSTGSFAYSLLEILYYGIVVFILRPQSSLLQILQGAGITFLYRIALGTVFGIMLAVMYNLNFSVSLTLGISRYLPAILLHILAAPFTLRPIYRAMFGDAARERRHYIKKYQPPTASRETTGHAPTAPAEHHRASAVFEHGASEPRSDSSVGHEQNGFDRAVRYLAEHHAVLLAAVVDLEGLTVASFKRGNVDLERWAPLSLLLQKSNEKILKRNREGEIPDRIDMSFASMKLIVVKAGYFNLLVLANREEDDLLGIRIIQATELIKKYTSERYGAAVSYSAEEKYVSNS
ncbi:MAG: hypothetical protein AB1690_01285 [Candidatus Zixiibacteriota bacterium]